LTRASLLAIDAGNSRVKWGLRVEGQWHEQGVLDTRALAGTDRAHLAAGRVDRAIVSNVAGPEIESAIRRIVTGISDVEWLRASELRCGVRNRYDEPHRLGADRWAALIGARALAGAPCCVVITGTATTVDLLDAAGEFLGGLILPGLGLMREVLHGRTGKLPLARGRYVQQPRNTDDAIESGCRLAQIAAIERMRDQLGAGTRCILSGGAAQVLAADLRTPIQVIDNLVLEGLARIAESSFAQDPKS
jgi:type III pantothenate kinase